VIANTLQVRKVEKKDEPILAGIIRAVFEEHDAPRRGTVYADPTTDHLFDLFDCNGAVLWVAVLKNEIVGCCGIYPTDGLPNHTAELVKFYLSPHARGLGVGKKLMELSIQSAKQLGYQELYLESMPAFSKAVKLYTQLGFKKLEKAMGNSGHTSCSIWMLLKLTNN